MPPSSFPPSSHATPSTLCPATATFSTLGHVPWHHTARHPHHTTPHSLGWPAGRLPVHAPPPQRAHKSGHPQRREGQQTPGRRPPPFAVMADRDVDGDQRWACAMLLLVNALLGRHLSSKAGCAPLAAVRVGVPPEACTSLKVPREGRGGRGAGRGPGGCAAAALAGVAGVAHSVCRAVQGGRRGGRAGRGEEEGPALVPLVPPWRAAARHTATTALSCNMPPHTHVHTVEQTTHARIRTHSAARTPPPWPPSPPCRPLARASTARRRPGAWSRRRPCLRATARRRGPACAPPPQSGRWTTGTARSWTRYAR